MKSSEQIKAYLLWLLARGLQIPVSSGALSAEMEIPDTDITAGLENTLRVIFLTDLPLEACEQGSSTSTANEQKALLDRMIVAMHLQPEEYLVAATFPPGTRAEDLADSKMIEAKRKELKEFVQNRPPHLVITLGQQAAKLALNDGSAFWRQRGEVIHSPELRGLAVLSTLHPRDLLRFPGNKRLAWTDLQRGMQYLGSAS